jgi:hypothetical protein
MSRTATATMSIDKRSMPVKQNPYEIRFDRDEVVLNTVIPKDKEDIPQIIGWSAPVRSGTTAFLYLLASQPGVDRAYFQPQMAILRTGGPVFNISSSDKIICMKEVFGGDPTADVRTHDPIELLLKAGVPPEKITWVTMLREPIQAFGSSYQINSKLTPEVAAQTQQWALGIFERHKKNGVNMIPYVYELARDNEERAVKALFTKLGLPFKATSLKFDSEAINRKLVLGQLADNEYVKDTSMSNMDKTKYSFKERRYDTNLPSEIVERVRELCNPAYANFREMARRELGL